MDMFHFSWAYPWEWNFCILLTLLQLNSSLEQSVLHSWGVMPTMVHTLLISVIVRVFIITVLMGTVICVHLHFLVLWGVMYHLSNCEVYIIKIDCK